MTRSDSPTFVVLSDLHANARALTEALRLAHEGPMDQLVILGDLLTYGTDVDEVLDAVATAQAVDGAWLFLGNHDQLYLDLHAGRRDYYARLPDWIRESADDTLKRLDVSAFRDRLVWQEERIVDRLLFSHANPFGHGDWRYLNSADDHAAAFARLRERDLSAGVFGHTHRAKVFVQPQAGPVTERSAVGRVDVGPLNGGLVAMNPGSIGQPRDSLGASGLLRLTWDVEGPTLDFVRVEYDVKAHVQALQASTFSAPTKERLCSFFAPVVDR